MAFTPRYAMESRSSFPVENFSWSIARERGNFEIARIPARWNVGILKFPAFHGERHLAAAPVRTEADILLYGVGLPSAVDPANTCRHTARITFLPLAIFEPSRARNVENWSVFE